MNFEIITDGNGEYLRLVFNAIAMIFGSDDYTGAMAVSAMIGVVGVLVKAAFDKSVADNYRYMIAMIAFIMLVLTPKSTVIVKDRLITNNIAVVNNVPLGLAATAGFFNAVGNYLSETFETVFSMPGSMNYTDTGFLFTQKLIDRTSKATFYSDLVDRNFAEFFKSCVIVDGIGNNRFTWNAMMESDDLLSFFGSNVARNSAYFQYFNSSSNSSILACRDGFNNQLKPAIEADAATIIEKNINPYFVSFFGTEAKSKQIVRDAINTIFPHVAGTTKNAEGTIVQYAIMNSMSDSAHKLSQEAEAGEYSDWITSGSHLQRLVTYESTGQVAAEKLPILKNIFEAFLYGIFPIIALFAIVSPSKVMTGYTVALAWVSLWAPMYALVNFGINVHEKSGVEAAIGIHGGLNTVSKEFLVNYNAEMAATAGYLIASIPLIAWMLLSRSGALASSLAGKMMQGYETTVASEAKEVVDGNMSRMDQQAVMASGGGLQTSVVDPTGSKITTTANGGTVIDQAGAVSNTAITPQSTSEVTEQRENAWKESITREDASRSDLIRSNEAVMDNVNSVMSLLSQNNATNDSYKTAETAAIEQSVARVDNAMDAFEKQTGIKFTDEEKASIRAEASIGFSAFGTGASAGVRGEGSTSAQELDSDSMVSRFMASDQYSDVMKHNVSAANNLEVSYGTNDTDQYSESSSSALKEALRAQETHQDSISDRESAEQAFKNASRISDAIQVNGSQALVEQLTSMGHKPEEVSNIILAAAKGDDVAMNEVNQALSTLGYDSASNNGLTEAEQRLVDRADNQAQVKAGWEAEQLVTNTDNDTSVSDTNTANDLAVAAMAPVTESTVTTAQKEARDQYNVGMDDPNSLTTPSGAYNELEAEREAIQSKGADLSSGVGNAIAREGELSLPGASIVDNMLDKQDELEELRTQLGRNEEDLANKEAFERGNSAGVRRRGRNKLGNDDE